MRLAESEGRLTRWRDLMAEMTPHDLVEIHAYTQVVGAPWRRQLHADVASTFLLGSAFSSKFPGGEQVHRAMSLEEESEQEMTPDQMAAHAIGMARSG